MALTIHLTPGEEARLAAAAAAEGILPAELAQRLVAEHLPPAVENGAGEDPTLALFAQWGRDDAQMTAEEAEEERRLWEQFESGINETRRALGMRQL
jgi:hypothetical protein